jgi:large subunit ribosomal protein L19
MNAVDKIEREQMRLDIPAFRPGDTVKVHIKIREGEKDRIQVFQGVVIARKNAAMRSSFTVRKISYSIGVEKIFPLHSPSIDRIELVQRGKVRRSRLFYLRDLKGKAARVKVQRY